MFTGEWWHVQFSNPPCGPSTPYTEAGQTAQPYPAVALVTASEIRQPVGGSLCKYDNTMGKSNNQISFKSGFLLGDVVIIFPHCSALVSIILCCNASTFCGVSIRAGNEPSRTKFEISQSRRRPLLGPSAGWKCLVLWYLRHCAKWALTHGKYMWNAWRQCKYH